MIRPADLETSGADPSPPPSDHDERVGEAIESYLSLIEQGEVPDPDQFAARFPDLEQDVLAALHGLELVNGLVGHLPGGSTPGSSSRPSGPGRSLESGRRIAGYRIVRELGRGGMGTVYEAVHIALDRPVALKILGSHAAPDSSARRRFLNEARTAARLHHTNIVPVFDVGQVGGLCYYAMQRIEGTGLDRVVRAQRRSRTPLGDTRPSQSSLKQDAARDRAVTTSLNPSNSSHSSRLGQLWVRVSAGWLKRPAHEGIDNDRAKARASNGVQISRRGEPQEFRHLDDSGFPGSTGSWNGSALGESGGRPVEKVQNPGLLGLSQSSKQQPTEFLAGPATEDGADEAPFTPPKGSSFYRWVAEIGLQAAEALAHAHHQGVIHRDVKPSNLLIDSKGTVWVTDFGLARRLADPGLTQHDSLLGTPRYMSPEQARPGTIDGRTDVFSLGGTLYELLTLRPAFDGKSAAQLVEQIAKVDPPPLRSIDPRIPRDLETIVLKMLAKRPADRYSSAASLAEDLARFLNHEPVKARRISPIGRMWRVARRHPGITGVSTVAAATILAVATYAHIRVVNALDKSEKANDRNVALLRTSHWQNAVLLRLSPGMLGRRAQAFELIKKAAELSPDPDLKQKLRDEAVDSLFIRDVEKEVELETGRVRGLIFESGGNRLASVSETDAGEQLIFWDIKQRLHGEAIPLGLHPRQPVAIGDSPNNPSAASLPYSGYSTETSATDEKGENSGTRRSATNPGRVASPNPGGGSSRSGPGGSQGGPGRFRFGRMTTVGNAIAVILPSDRQSRFAEAFARHQIVDIIGLALAGQGFEKSSLLDRWAFSSRNQPLFFTRDRGLRLFDAITGEKIRDIHTPLGNVIGVYGGLNGHFVTIDQEPFAGRTADFQRRFQINLWDLDSPEKPIARLEGPKIEVQAPSPGSTPCLGFAPNGEKVAIGWGSAVVVFSTKDGTQLSKFDAQSPLTAVAIGPNDLMATAGGGNVRFWDLESETTFVSSLTPTQNVVLMMKFSPDGAVLALVGRDEPTIELVDPLSRSQIALLRASDRVSDLVFAPDGRSLAAGGQGLTTTVWKILGSNARIQLSGFDEMVSSLAFRKDGFLAIGTVDGEIWGSRMQSLVGTSCTPLVPNTPGQKSISPVSTEFASSRPPSPSSTPTLSTVGSTNLSQELLPDRIAGPEREQRTFRDRSQAIALAYDDQDRLVVAHESDAPRVSPNQAEFQPMGSMISVPLSRMNGPQRGFGFQFPSLSRTADGREMLVSRASRFFLWRSDFPEKLVPVFAPGSDRETGFGSETINANSGTQPTTRPGSPGFGPMSAQGRGARGGNGNRLPGGLHYGMARLAPGGHRMYLIDFESGSPQAWDLVEADEHIQARRIDWPRAPREIVGLALSRDGGLLALGRRDGSIVLVETQSLRPAGVIDSAGSEGSGTIQTIAFAPDARALAVATQHGPVFLWKLKKPDKSDSGSVSWESRFQLRLPVHRGPIRLLAFDPKGVRLAGAGTEPLVEVWNIHEIYRELSRLGLDD